MVEDYDLTIRNADSEYFPYWNWEEFVRNRLSSNFTRGNKLKQFIDEHPEIHGWTGEQFQRNPLLEHEVLKIIGWDHITWRSWGAIMAAYMNEKEKVKKYCYMSFYM